MGAKSWGFLRAAGFAQGGVGLTTPLLSAEREGPATKPALVPPLLPCKRCCSFCWAAGSTCQGWGESSQIPFSSPCPHKSVQLIFLLSTAVSFPCLCSVEKKLLKKLMSIGIKFSSTGKFFIICCSFIYSFIALRLLICGCW